VFKHLLKADFGSLDIADLVDVSFDLHVVLTLCEHLFGDRAGGNPVDRLPRRGATAATPVPGAEFRGVGVIAV